MKNDLDRFLLFDAVFFLALSIASCWVDIRGLLFLPGCSVFCFQLLACRRAKGWGVRLAPLWILLAWAAVGLLILLTARGWDGLLGGIMLYASISPAVAIVLAWVGYIVCTRPRP